MSEAEQLLQQISARWRTLSVMTDDRGRRMRSRTPEDVRRIEAEIRTLADQYTALVTQQYDARDTVTPTRAYFTRRRRTG